jgi:hypothetical protein
VAAGAPDRSEELHSLLEDVSFELSGARAAGLSDLVRLRAALKRARELIADADALAASVGVERRTDQD